MNKTDEFIECCRELQVQVESLRNIIASRSQELQKLNAQAISDDKLVIEGAQALSNLIGKSEKQNLAKFSQHQMSVMKRFLELASRPSFSSLRAVPPLSGQEQSAAG
ncbi:MAG: hypothetical protein WC647_04005 [Desulfomonilaceae bacterium]|jgi:hypothetical protein